MIHKGQSRVEGDGGGGREGWPRTKGGRGRGRGERERNHLLYKVDINIMHV